MVRLDCARSTPTLVNDKIIFKSVRSLISVRRRPWCARVTIGQNVYGTHLRDVSSFRKTFRRWLNLRDYASAQQPLYTQQLQYIRGTILTQLGSRIIRIVAIRRHSRRRISVGSARINSRMQTRSGRRAQIGCARRRHRVNGHTAGDRGPRRRCEPVVRRSQSLRAGDTIEQAAGTAGGRRTTYDISALVVARASAAWFGFDDRRTFRPATVTVQYIVMFQVHRAHWCTC